MKLATRNFKGQIVRAFRVEAVPMGGGAEVKPADVHLILSLDRSGSMYGSMAQMRSTVEKLLTLEEFRSPRLRVSLISTSSKGDVTVHFQRVAIGDVMAAGSPFLQKIRSIQATCLTCLSQALVEAEKMVRDDEVTAISYHTDGFANDPSPSMEQRDIAAAVKKLGSHPNLFVNTIAYGGYCDYQLLAGIANALSGKCTQARGIGEVYDAMRSTILTLSGSMAPTVEVPKGAADSVLFVSRSANKVLGSTDSLSVRGLAAKDDKAAYRLYTMPVGDYDTSPEAEVAPEVALAYARTRLAAGDVNGAKYAMLAARNPDLLSHSRALVSSEVADFSVALEGAVFNPKPFTPTAQYGLPATGPSVLRVLQTLDKYHSGLRVNLDALTANYKRRGVRRIEGVRREDGSVETPTVRSEVVSKDPFVAVGGFDVNRNTASINMLVTRPIRLVTAATGEPVKVEGVSLAGLASFNNYTIVGDGSLTVPGLEVQVNDKATFTALSALGIGVTGEYQPGVVLRIDLSTLPLVDYDQRFEAVDRPTLDRLAGCLVVGKILSSVVKGTSTAYTKEQVDALKAVYLTTALNFSPPTTTEYADLQKALAVGQVDTRLSYKIDLGTPELTSMSKLRSGNEYLQRRFTVKSNGADVPKPTLDLLSSGAKLEWGVKKLTAATKLDTVDAISYPIYSALLGLGPIDPVVAALGAPLANEVLAALHAPTADAVVLATTEVRGKVDAVVEGIYDLIRPLAFYVGAAGLVPDELGAVSYTAEDFAKVYPDAKLSKDEKEEGTFHPLPNGTVLTVFVKGEYYSTGSAAVAA